VEIEALRQHLDADFGRFRSAVVAATPGTPVPTCPGWTVSDLTSHLAGVYLHKVECTRHGVEPNPWPPAGLEQEAAAAPVALLERAYAELTTEFDSREPEAAAGGWYVPDRTVGFLVRRMAQETAIHRLDAELAAGMSPAQVPDDLALDGIDEFLYRFLAYATGAWLEWASSVLHGTDNGAVRLATPSGGWLVRPTPEGVKVSSDEPVDVLAEVTAAPSDLLCWLWGRFGDDRVTITGDVGRVDQLRRILTFVAQ
jgi:uncharacterized protein (TIGR03083 family)